MAPTAIGSACSWARCTKIPIDPCEYAEYQQADECEAYPAANAFRQSVIPNNDVDDGGRESGARYPAEYFADPGFRDTRCRLPARLSSLRCRDRAHGCQGWGQRWRPEGYHLIGPAPLAHSLAPDETVALDLTISHTCLDLRISQWSKRLLIPSDVPVHVYTPTVRPLQNISRPTSRKAIAACPARPDPPNWSHPTIPRRQRPRTS
jgi:hypothetical protein